MRVAIDHERCQGHGRCHALAADIFELDDLGYSALRADDDLTGDHLEAAHRAVAGCPERALRLIPSAGEVPQG
ncbi:MAG TPA: ferredoxin [Acidimicrobiia bacterium]|nr:ferredoxin [Acidimicrobiia bacterium]